MGAQGAWMEPWAWRALVLAVRGPRSVRLRIPEVLLLADGKVVAWLGSESGQVVERSGGSAEFSAVLGSARIALATERGEIDVCAADRLPSLGRYTLAMAVLPEQSLSS